MWMMPFADNIAFTPMSKLKKKIHDSSLDAYQWIYELRCKIAVENYICQQGYKQKEKIPCDELLSKIHGL